MTQIKLLKTITQAPGIYPTPRHRAKAIANLQQKINRRDRKVKACTQLHFDFTAKKRNGKQLLKKLINILFTPKT